MARAIMIGFSIVGISNVDPDATVNNLELETGDNRLLETGDFRLLETATI